MTEQDERFNYVIARFWDSDFESLCCYAYGTQVMYGTQADAEKVLDYVNNSPWSANKGREKYQIVKIPTDTMVRA